MLPDATDALTLLMFGGGPIAYATEVDHMPWMSPNISTPKAPDPTVSSTNQHMVSGLNLKSPENIRPSENLSEHSTRD